MAITAKEVAEEVVKILEEKGLAGKKVNINRYAETESMLRSYTGYKGKLEKNENEIREIKERGIRCRNQKSVLSENVQGGKKTIEGLPEKELNRIEYLEEENRKLEKRIFRVEDALRYFESDRYFKIIELRYFKNWTIEEIAIEMGVTEKTVGKNRTRLVEKIQYLLFPEILID